MNQWHRASAMADQEHICLYIMIIMTTCTTQTAMCHWNAKVPQGGGLEKKLVCSDSWEMTGLAYSFQTYGFGFSSLDVQYQPFPTSFR